MEKNPTPIVENTRKNCRKEYSGKGRQAPPPPLHSKTCKTFKSE